MFKKAFQVQVELEIQAVSCPGVWLCPNGKISLQVYMLGSSIQTSSLEPVFPLLYHEKFIFCKKFCAVQKLNELQKELNKELLYAELIQWKHCDTGNVLAIFETTIADLLFPACRSGTMSGIDVDLLMEPMKNFPGILAPKIEVRTRTVIEDKICQNDDGCKTYVLNPQIIASSGPPERLQHNSRQKQVCHSNRYHRIQILQSSLAIDINFTRKSEKATKCSDSPRRQPIHNKPPFRAGKFDESLIIRKPMDMEGTGTCRCKSPEKVTKHRTNVDHVCPKPTVKRSPRKSVACMKITNDCSCAHSQETCAVCSKYKYYFESEAPSIKSKRHSPQRMSRRVEEPKRYNCQCDEYNNNSKLCNYPPKIQESLAEKIHSRLTDTLYNYCPSRATTNRPLSNCDCLSDDGSCTVSSFGQFYKDLYRKSKSKCEQYISCN